VEVGSVGDSETQDRAGECGDVEQRADAIGGMPEYAPENLNMKGRKLAGYQTTDVVEQGCA